MSIQKEILWKSKANEVVNSDLKSVSKLVCHAYNLIKIENPYSEVTVKDLSKYCSLSPRSVRKHVAECNKRGFEIDVDLDFTLKNKWQIIRAKVFAQKGSLCFYCGSDAWHVDHVTPRSKGGSDKISNLVPACGPCNFSKGSKTLEQWSNLV